MPIVWRVVDQDGKAKFFAKKGEATDFRRALGKGVEREESLRIRDRDQLAALLNDPAEYQGSTE